MPLNKEQLSMVLPDETIVSKIYVIRGQKVILDEDLALLYQVATKRLNEQVKRNSNAFRDFIFRLNAEDLKT